MVPSIPAPMQRWRTRFALLTVSRPTVLTAHAESAAPGKRPDPLDANARVPTLATPPSLAAYRRLDNSQPIAWREANDTVARIGGWRVYAREAQPAASAAQPMPAAQDSPVRP